MQSHAADQEQAAMADLMGIAKWKAPHASTVAWQAGLDEIDRFYRSDISHSTTGPQPIESFGGSSNEFNAQQAGSTSSQSLFSPAHKNLVSFSPYKVPLPLVFELTAKQIGASLLQNGQAAEPLPQPDSSVPKPADKLHPPHASSSLDQGDKTSLPELKQTSQSSDVETLVEPPQTQHQPPSTAVESDLPLPPTQQPKKIPSPQSQSTLPRSKSAQRDSSTPLLPKTHKWPPLQQIPQWEPVGIITARPKWTLEPPPPPGLQPAFEEKGKASDVGATGEASQVAIPLREKREKGGSPRLGGAAVAGDEVAEGDQRREKGFVNETEEHGVVGADEKRGSEGLGANVTERDQVADLNVCRKEKASDGMRSDRQDDAKGSEPDGNASPATRHASAPDAVAANEEFEHDEHNQHTEALQHDDNTTTLPNPPDQPTPAAEPHINPNALNTNPPRWSPASSRNFSNARDEIASLKRGRKNSSTTRSSSSNPPHSASSPPPLAKKKKKNPRHDQTPTNSHARAEASEQSPPEESNPENTNTDSVNPPTPADQESPVDTADSEPPAPDLHSTQTTSSSSAREKPNQSQETKKRKRSPRRAMSKRELSNLDGTTVEGKLRRRGGVQERREREQLQLEQQVLVQVQVQRKQKQKQQVQEERKGQKAGQEEEVKGKGEQKDGRQGKGKESPANGDGAGRRKRQRRS
ncbi:hypothetical protein NU219Hw_g4837t1 [Hortaea werneckii]